MQYNGGMGRNSELAVALYRLGFCVSGMSQ